MLITEPQGVCAQDAIGPFRVRCAVSVAGGRWGLISVGSVGVIRPVAQMLRRGMRVSSKAKSA